jgi:hypothetical protein
LIFWGIRLKKFFLFAVLLIVLSSSAFAYIDVNINSWQQIDSNRYIGNKNGSRSFVLDFNVLDTNASVLDLNARISFGAIAGTATINYNGRAIAGYVPVLDSFAWKNTGSAGVVFDLNLFDMNATGACTGIGTKWAGGMRCLWKWDLNYPATDLNYLDGNKVVDINVFSWRNGKLNFISDGNNDSSSFYLDMTVPDLNTPIPSIFTTVSTSTPSFTVLAGDVNSLFDYCIAFVSLDDAASTSSTVALSGGKCSKTVTLNWVQKAEVDFRGFDRSGNYADSNTDEYEYSISGGGTPANIPQGGASWTTPPEVVSPVAPQAPVPSPFEAMPVVQPQQPVHIPILSDVIKGALMVWNWFIGLFRFR